MSNTLQYIYTIGGVVARIVPYRPLYELCDYAGGIRSHCYKLPSATIDYDQVRTYSLTDGWGVKHVSEVSKEMLENVNHVYQTTLVHDKLLSLTNSLKMRYIAENSTGFIEQYLLDQEIEDNQFGPISQAIAMRHKLDFAGLKVWNELHKKDMAATLAQCIEAKTKTIELCKAGKYDTAIAWLHNQLEKMKI